MIKKIVKTSFLAAFAGVSLFAANMKMTPSKTVISSGESFDVDVLLDLDVAATGTDYFVKVSPNGSGLFTLTDVDYTGSVFDTPSAFISPVPDVLDPQNEVTLGGVLADILASVPPGNNLFLSTITITAGNLQEGETYNFSFVEGLIGSVVYDESYMVVPTTFEDFDVTVEAAAVPEPSAFALFGLCGLMMMRRRR